MRRLPGWWRSLGRQWRLRLSIQGVLMVICLIAQGLIGYELEQHVVNHANHQAQKLADHTLQILNNMMIGKTGVVENISDPASRQRVIKGLITEMKHVEQLRVVRSHWVDDEFGQGLPEEQPEDEMDRQVLQTGKALTLLKIENGEAQVRTVVPFRSNQTHGSFACLDCHGADPGAILGAASITIDVTDELSTAQTMKWWLWAGQMVLQIKLYFVIRLIVRQMLLRLGRRKINLRETIRRIYASAEQWLSSRHS